MCGKLNTWQSEPLLADLNMHTDLSAICHTHCSLPSGHELAFKLQTILEFIRTMIGRHLIILQSSKSRVNLSLTISLTVALVALEPVAVNGVPLASSAFSLEEHAPLASPLLSMAVCVLKSFPRLLLGSTWSTSTMTTSKLHSG